MNQFGYMGIAFLIAFENIFPPIPSEAILTFGGFMTLSTNMSVLGVCFASTIGSIIGAIVLYMIGRCLNKNRLYKLVDGKVGKLLKFKREDIDKSEEWFTKKGEITVLICRFIPIVRSLISIPAGMTGMNFVRFCIYTVLGSITWNYVLIWLGVFAGNAWESVVRYVGNFAKIVFAMLVVIFGIVVVLFYKKRLKPEKN